VTSYGECHVSIEMCKSNRRATRVGDLIILKRVRGKAQRDVETRAKSKNQKRSGEGGDLKGDADYRQTSCQKKSVTTFLSREIRGHRPKTQGNRTTAIAKNLRTTWGNLTIPVGVMVTKRTRKKFQTTAAEGDREDAWRVEVETARGAAGHEREPNWEREETLNTK